MKRIPALDHAMQEVYEWLNEINNLAGWDNNFQAYAALRAVLRLIRDNLTLDTSAKLASQLSPLVRGFYYENWHPVDQPLRERSKEDFIDNLMQILRDYNHPEIDPEVAACSVFEALSKKIDSEEAEKIYAQLPRGVRKVVSEEM